MQFQKNHTSTFYFKSHFSIFAQQDSVLSGAYKWKTAIPIIDKISTAFYLKEQCMILNGCK